MKVPTLWEQLSQENKDLIMTERAKYPYSTGNLLDDLNKYYGSTFLRVTSAMTLDQILSNKPFDLDRFFNYFDQWRNLNSHHKEFQNRTVPQNMLAFIGIKTSTLGLQTFR